MPLTAQIKEFVEWKNTHSAKAAKSYPIWLRRFNDIVNKPISDIETEDIAKFSKWVQSRYSNTTHAYAMTILHVFFSYQNKRGRGIPADLIRVKRQHAKSHLPAEDNEYRSILETFDINDFYGLRNTCMIKLLGECGMRVSELVSLNVNDIDLREHFARIRNAKSHRERRIIWSDDTNNLLASYMAQRTCSTTNTIEMKEKKQKE